MTSFPVDAPVDILREAMQDTAAGGATCSAQAHAAAKYSVHDCGYARGYAPLFIAKCLLFNGKISLRGTI